MQQYKDHLVKKEVMSEIETLPYKFQEELKEKENLPLAVPIEYKNHYL